MSTTSHQLFKYDSCPFCHRVRAFMQEAGIEVELRDIQTDPDAFRELLAGGGRSTVPCLRIEHAGEVRWLYESADIIAYMQKHLAPDVV